VNVVDGRGLKKWCFDFSNVSFQAMCTGFPPNPEPESVRDDNRREQTGNDRCRQQNQNQC
jgi:hypothetical protein